MCVFAGAGAHASVGKCMRVLACLCVCMCGREVDTRARECACTRVTLLIQHATPMRRIVCGLSGTTTFFDTLTSGMIFGKKIAKHKMCTSILCSTLFEMFIILKIIQRGSVTNLKTLLCKIPVILVRF